jgi:hypothetical protein
MTPHQLWITTARDSPMMMLSVRFQFESSPSHIFFACGSPPALSPSSSLCSKTNIALVQKWLPLSSRNSSTLIQKRLLLIQNWAPSLVQKQLASLVQKRLSSCPETASLSSRNSFNLVQKQLYSRPETAPLSSRNNSPLLSRIGSGCTQTIGLGVTRRLNKFRAALIPAARASGSWLKDHVFAA